MDYLCVVLELEAEAAERMSDALLEGGALSVSVEDPLAGTPQEVPVFDEPDWERDGAVPRWSLQRLQVLFDAAESAGIAERLAVAAQQAGLPALPDFRLEAVADQDWVRLTQAQFSPIRISARLWIVPSWHAAPDPGALNIALDPGIAFGTGSHPTTRLCLRWLEANIAGGESVIDYGCGSGILAIAAGLLGAGHIAGTDIEAAAVQAAADNAQRNGVPARFFTADQLPADPADRVVANILANPLRMLGPVLARLTRSGGRLALSGILEHQAEELMQNYAQWFDMAQFAAEEGWVCLQGMRR